jgi:hypothetical protein
MPVKFRSGGRGIGGRSSGGLRRGKVGFPVCQRVKEAADYPWRKNCGSGEEQGGNAKDSDESRLPDTYGEISIAGGGTKFIWMAS